MFSKGPPRLVGHIKKIYSTLNSLSLDGCLAFDTVVRFNLGSGWGNVFLAIGGIPLHSRIPCVFAAVFIKPHTLSCRLTIFSFNQSLLSGRGQLWWMRDWGCCVRVHCSKQARDCEKKQMGVYEGASMCQSCRIPDSDI